jgi:DNA replication protein DnaC
MESIRAIARELEEKLRLLREKRGDSEVIAEPSVDVCPTCLFPLKGTAHGWVKDYSTHFDHAGHYPKFGYCEVPCPTCAGDAERRRSAKQQAELVSRLFGTSQIPFQARTWTFGTYPADADQDAYRLVWEFVERHLKGDEDNKRGLYLGGSAGRGKTSLAVSALKEVMGAGQIGLFVMTLELMNRLRASFGKESHDSQDDLLTAVTEVPWLVLDDLAVERPTSYVLEQFYYIVEKRRSHGLYTIFTSNLSTKDLEAYWRPDGLAVGAFHAGSRVTERIKEYALGFNVRGRNLREGKAR